MRVSTAMFHDTATRLMLDRQSGLLHTQEQLSTGRRVLRPADDPVAAAQALRVEQSQAFTAQHAANAARASEALAQAENHVARAGDLLGSIRDTLVQAGSGALADSDRRALAVELRARFAELLGAANAEDGQGRHLFAGYAEEALPFVDDGTNVTYVGDGAARGLAIGPTRTLPTTVPGSALFEGIPVGQGAFTTAVGPANAGNVSVGVGELAPPPALLDGHDYDVVFSVAGGATTYEIRDVTLGAVVSTGNPYSSGARFTVGGASIAASGTPANGDAVRVRPAATQNVFATVREAIALLEAPTATPASRGALTTGLERALANVDHAFDRALAVRAALGASMREAQDAGTASEALAVEQARELSGLVDLDYARAISDFTRQQQALEAAQKAYLGASRLALFDLL